MVRLHNIFATIAALLLLLTSCDATIHFYPEAEEEVDSQIRLNVDWSQYGKDVPTGMTVICHHTETGERVHTIDNNIAYVTPRLSQGRHWATVFNLTEDEFSFVGFRGLETAETAEAYAVQAPTSRWYAVRAASDEIIAAQPEWLAVDTIMTDHVKTSPDASRAETQVIGTLYPKNIIYTLHVKIQTENISNLSSARGGISGLASGRRFAADEPNDNSVTVTHLIESNDWARSRSAENPDNGTVTADIRCFGLPGNHTGTPEENVLEFQVLLADGSTVMTYSMPVGDLIKEATPPPGRRGDELDLYLELTLDPPLPPGGSDDWGFDAWVEDWDEVVVDIPI